MGKGAAWKGDGGGGRVLSQDSDKTKGIFPQNRFSSKINRYTSPLVGVWVYLPWSAWLLGRGIEKTGGEGGGVAGGGCYGWVMRRIGWRDTLSLVSPCTSYHNLWRRSCM